MDLMIKDEIMKLGNKLFIGLSSCKVTERYHLLQCYRCQSFGHKRGSNQCSLENTDNEVCLYCASNHLSKHCKVKTDVSSRKCNNCMSSKDPNIRTRHKGHTTTSAECI